MAVRLTQLFILHSFILGHLWQLHRRLTFIVTLGYSHSTRLIGRQTDRPLQTEARMSREILHCAITTL